MGEGVSVYLHNVWLSTGRARPSPGGMQSPAVVVELHYLVTAWGPDSARQQRLLGWAIQTLLATPVLPAAALNASAGRLRGRRAGDDHVGVARDRAARGDLAGRARRRASRRGRSWRASSSTEPWAASRCSRPSSRGTTSTAAICRGGARATRTRSSSRRSWRSRRRSPACSSATSAGWRAGRRRAALAEATVAEVLTEWSGLGYNQRALRLRAACVVVARDGWPRRRRRPARAARHRPVHGGGGRVVRLRRARGGGRHERPPGRRAPRRGARALLPQERHSDWNQAAMELGARVCTARAPRCEACPAAAWCPSRGIVAPARRGSRSAAAALRGDRSLGARAHRRRAGRRRGACPR